MKKILATAALALPLFAAGYASAGEPLPLTDSEMDTVSAGAITSAGGTALALAAGPTGAGAAAGSFGAAATLFVGPFGLAYDGTLSGSSAEAVGF